MNTLCDGLRARLDGFELDEPGAPLPFSARLARENGWTLAFAGRVIREYKRFLYLTAVAGHTVTPSEEVDQAWHLHMVYTRSYWDKLCGQILGRPLHHDPTSGGRAEGEKFHGFYTQTLESYRREFGGEPPPDIWPPPGKRFAPPAAQWVDRSRYWLVPRIIRLPRVLHRTALWTAVVSAAAALPLSGCVPGFAAAWSPFDLTGQPFLLLYLVCMAATIFWSLHIRRKKRDKFNASEAPEDISDPYKLAMLAGGAPRVMQTALARLVDSGTLMHADRGRLKRGAPNPDSLHKVEEAVMRRIGNSSSGVKIKELLTSARDELHSLEVSLAVKGLKPTAVDRGNAGCAAALPFLLLIGFGAIKVVIGLSRHRPVEYLVMLIILTFIIMIVMMTRSGKLLTPQGEALLKRKRAEFAGAPAIVSGTPNAVALNVALLGTAALAAIPEMDPLRRELDKYPAGPGGSGAGSSGCSSGCGTASGGGDSGGGGAGAVAEDAEGVGVETNWRYPENSSCRPAPPVHESHTLAAELLSWRNW